MTYPLNLIAELGLRRDGKDVLVPSFLLEIDRLTGELRQYVKIRYESIPGYVVALSRVAERMGVSQNKVDLYEIRLRNYFHDERVQTHFTIGQKARIEPRIEIERLYDILHHIASGNVLPEQLTFADNPVVERPQALERFTPIELVDFNYGDYNKLARNHITHVEQLDAMSREDVLHLNSIGEASLVRIERAIREYGYDLTYERKPLKLPRPTVRLQEALEHVDTLAKKARDDRNVKFPVDMYVKAPAPSRRKRVIR